MLLRPSVSLIALAICLAHCRNYNPRMTFDARLTPSAPRYADPANWAALPQRTDIADRTPGPQYPDMQDSTDVDVFFLHPTTLTEDVRHGDYWNADPADPTINKKTDGSSMRYQASVFNGVGRVYAPRYRQAHLYSFRTKDKASAAQALDTAYTDVLAAFDYYLKHYNQGRRFIIAGHSQGARHAKQLIRDRVEGKPLQKQLVVAYLLGWPVEYNYFKQLPPCTSPEQTDCFCSWRTYERRYGLKNASQKEVVCTNPILWTIEEGSYAPKALHKGAVLYDFERVYPRICDAEVYKGVLLCTKPKFKGSWLLRTKNYHPGDINLYYINVRENAQLRAKQ
jgi:Protein of unknown function (DUF3089)